MIDVTNSRVLRGPGLPFFFLLLLPLVVSLPFAAFADDAPVSEPFPGFETPEDLARHVLDAFERKDEAALRRYCITTEEYKNYLWPELPFVKAGKKLPFSFVYGRHYQFNEAAIPIRLRQHGGQKLELVDLLFGEPDVYDTVRVLTEAHLVVRSEDGTEHKIRLYGAVFVHNGLYKVFTYFYND